MCASPFTVVSFILAIVSLYAAFAYFGKFLYEQVSSGYTGGKTLSCVFSFSKEIFQPINKVYHFFQPINKVYHFA